MKREEKILLAKKVYRCLNDYPFEVYRETELQADYFCIPNVRGFGGVIIGDDGSYLFCDTIHPYSYWEEKFKNGVRNAKKS